MKSAASVDAFAADPVGSFVVGPTYMLWCPSARLIGATHWGPFGSDLADIVKRMSLAEPPALAGGLDSFTDVRAIQSLELSLVSVVLGQLRAELEGAGGRVRRHAIIISPGVVGALIAGFMALLRVKHRVRFFFSTEEAQDWLGRSELSAALEELAPIIAEARALSPTLSALRSYLDRSLHAATVESAAESMQISARTLQRELRQRDVTFKSELTAARLRAACFCLEHSDEKIDLVARRVGLSPSQFHLMFRQLVGVTPAEYRAGRRGGVSRIRSPLSSG
jgi:AraC-like DNA-binding protein